MNAPTLLIGTAVYGRPWPWLDRAALGEIEAKRDDLSRSLLRLSADEQWQAAGIVNTIGHLDRVLRQAYAYYGRSRPAWHAFVPQHPADCGCRRPAVDPWPGAPLLPPRRQIGAR